MHLGDAIKREQIKEVDPVLLVGEGGCFVFVYSPLYFRHPMTNAIIPFTVYNHFYLRGFQISENRQKN